METCRIVKSRGKYYPQLYVGLRGLLRYGARWITIYGPKSYDYSHQQPKEFEGTGIGSISFFVTEAKAIELAKNFVAARREFIRPDIVVKQWEEGNKPND